MRSRDRAAGASINPQARAAHLEVHAKYGRDILGLRAPEWEGSNRVHAFKLYGPPSHLSLDNHITAHHINPVDFRHLAGPTHQYQKQKEAAFTRGDATTGWNFATSLAALEAKYGKDGAAEMQRIANMHPVGIKRKHQATKQDLQAVTELDDPQNLSDTGYIT
ncbi:hypothetical protein WJX82_002205 [Trebouxia sp. C0006]